jgi:hypothetical protein
MVDTRSDKRMVHRSARRLAEIRQMARVARSEGVTLTLHRVGAVTASTVAAVEMVAAEVVATEMAAVRAVAVPAAAISTLTLLLS